MSNENTTYFVRRRGRVEGPWPINKLQAEVRLRKLGRHHEVSADGSQWQSAVEIDGLFQHGEVASEYAASASQPNDGQPAASAAIWFCCIGEDQRGPMTFEDLTALIRTGQVRAADLVWRDGQPEWLDAEHVPELFELFHSTNAASRQPVPSKSLANNNGSAAVPPQAPTTNKVMLASAGMLGVAVAICIAILLVPMFRGNERTAEVASSTKDSQPDTKASPSDPATSLDQSDRKTSPNQPATPSGQTDDPKSQGETNDAPQAPGDKESKTDSTVDSPTEKTSPVPPADDGEDKGPSDKTGSSDSERPSTADSEKKPRGDDIYSPASKKSGVVINSVEDEEKVAKAVALVVSGALRKTRDETFELKYATGTGFAISPDGYLLTNRHVVTFNSEEEQMIQQIEKHYTISRADRRVWCILDGEASLADVVYVSAKYDMAILKIDGSDLPYFKISDSESVRRTTKVYSLGFPAAAQLPTSKEEARELFYRERLFHNDIRDNFKDSDFDFVANDGAVSRVKYEGGESSVQHNAQINPGNSGGPLCLQDGTVVGINTRFVKGEGANVFYAVSTAQLKREINRRVDDVEWVSIDD